MQSDLIAFINTDHLAHNYSALRRCCRPGVKLCAPLKADAYGHGVAIVAPALQEAGADYAAVATLDEAVELREVGWQRPILVLGNVLSAPNPAERRERIAVVVEYDLTLTIADQATVQRLLLAEPAERISVHLKIDSGMGRMGALPAQAAALLAAVLRARCLHATGLYSHFATADFGDRALVARQLATFQQVSAEIIANLPDGLLRHMANSAATITLPPAHFDMVRPGLALYGYLPAPRMAEQIDLKPVLRVVSHLSAVKNLPPGHCVGYGRTFTTRRPTRLGIIPAGYFDGLPRSLSNEAVVGTPHGDAPIIGRISMDQLAVDLTDLPPLRVGTTVTLIDDTPGRPNAVATLADRLGTIPYEVTCLLGRRIQRVRFSQTCDLPPNRGQTKLNRNSAARRSVSQS